MKDQYVAQKLEKIQAALRNAMDWSASNPELGAYLAGYLVVMITGVFEHCIEYLVKRRATRWNDPELQSFVRSRISQTFRNPTHDKIRDVLRDFSTAYLNDYDKQVNTRAREALNSLVTNKNWLAHGETESMTVTMSDVNNYYQTSKDIIEIMERILG